MAEQLGLNLNFSGRKVLVTGGASGIGKVTAKTFLKLSASVIVLDVNREGLDALKSEHPEITTVCADLADWNGLEAALAPHHPIHHLVNNAAVDGRNSALAVVTEEQMDSVMNVNMKGGVRAAQLVSSRMIDAKIEGATIVNITSIGVNLSIPSFMAYIASKAAMDAITRTMAHELAPHKIRVNSLRPGLTKTEMVAQLPQEIFEKQVAETLKKMVYGHEIIDPQCVANAVVFLSSPMSEMMTGTSITVDAGDSLA